MATHSNLTAARRTFVQFAVATLSTAALLGCGGSTIPTGSGGGSGGGSAGGFAGGEGGGSAGGFAGGFGGGSGGGSAGGFAGGSGGGSGGGSAGGFAGGSGGGSAGGSAGGFAGGSGGGSAGGSGGGSGPTASQACSEIADAACNLRANCSDSYSVDKNYGDIATCESRAVTTCEAELALIGTGQTPANIESCVSDYSSYTCAEFYDGNPPAACSAPTGTQATGAPCAANAQCQTSFCQLGHGTVCGTCQDQPVAGMTCTIQADCGKDLACAMAAMATSGVCAAYVEAGGACLTATNPCDSGLSCVGEKASTMTMGVCKAAIATVGAACDGNHKTIADCDGDLGLACIPTASGSTSGTCQKITLVGAGATCGKIGSPVTSVADCEAGGECIKAASTDATGTCVAAAADGASCDAKDTVGPPCLAPSKCVPTSTGSATGICTRPDPSSCH